MKFLHDHSSFIDFLDNNSEKLLKIYNTPGFAIALIHKEETICVKGYGYSDVSNQVRMNNDTIFQVASISKSLTAFAIMHLVYKGLIDLDKPIENYLRRWKIPETNYNSSEVTVRRILSHTAGLSLSGYLGYKPDKSIPSIEQSLGKRVKIIKKPGEQFKYSGGGYTILQLLIEEVTGMNFSTFMYEHILKPLGMYNSSFELNEDMKDKITKCYGAFGHKMKNYVYCEKAAAGLYTNANELSKFVIASLYGRNAEVLRNNLIGINELKVMHLPVKPGYGLGFQIGELGNEKTILHTGGNPGWRSIFKASPEQGSGIVILTNSENGFCLIEELCGLWESFYVKGEMKLSDGNIRFRRKFSSKLSSLLIELLGFFSR